MLEANMVMVLLGMIIGTASHRAMAADEAESENPYMTAASKITAICPAASSLEYPAVPPFGEAWNRMAEESWTRNAEAFPIVRQARKVMHVNWSHGKASITQLNYARNLANTVGDAALYQHFHGDDHAAIELVRDVLAMSESLRGDLEPDDLIRVLVSIGIDALAMDRLITITCAISLSDNPDNATALKSADAKRLIKQLLDDPSSMAALEKIMNAKPDPNAQFDPAESSRAKEQANRSDSERALAAMALACHLFQQGKGRWPATLAELATQLPRVPVDPWGDGKETLGYILVKDAPSGSGERPLVYSRCESQDGLFYRIDQPQTCFYAFVDAGGGNRKRGGQFRDVTLWELHTGLEGIVGPTTRPLHR